MRTLFFKIIGASLLLTNSLVIASSTPVLVELQTNVGTIGIQPDYSHAPISTANFMAYVNNGFYKDVIFHRVVPKFVLQGGGVSRINGLFKTTLSPIKNEASNGLSNLAGTVAMARTADPNSATSQFYINLKDNTDLDYVSSTNPGYAVFGKVTNMTVARKIEALANYNNSIAFTSNANLVYIEAVYITDIVDTSVAKTRLLIKGVGNISSVPAGINCGNGGSSCSFSQTIGSATTLKLTATAGSGYAFTGWQGDCRGASRIITLSTLLGNHNCSAIFSLMAPVTQ